MPSEIHEERAGGIFIPFDKLLANMDEKLDRLMAQMTEISKTKVDVPVFESFRTSYEERHERVKSRVDTIERDLLGRQEIIRDFRASQVKIEDLEKDKAERDAVKAQMRYYLAGGGLVGLLVLVNLAVNAWQLVGK